MIRDFLSIALDRARRGWFVFPCVPRGKNPLVAGGFKAATLDEMQIRRWWTQWPNANVGIACGASGLCVLDCDHGNATLDEALTWIARSGLPTTYTVRTGRRFNPAVADTPECAVQLYYSGAIPGSGKFDLKGGRGDLQSMGDYVMAAGSIHPHSGAEYSVLVDAPIAPLPDWVRALIPPRRAWSGNVQPVDDATADYWKTWLLEYAVHHCLELRDYEKREPNGWWLGVMCPWPHDSGDEGNPSSTVLGILDGRLRFKCSHGTCEGAERNTLAFKREMWARFGAFRREPGDIAVTLGKRR